MPKVSAKVVTNGPTDPRESSLDTVPPQVIDQDQEPDQDDNRLLEGWRAAIAVGTNDGPLTSVSNS